jgi:hypothetical protein
MCTVLHTRAQQPHQFACWHLMAKLMCWCAAAAAAAAAKLRGHGEVVRGIASISTQSAYMTASWDGSLRLWRWPATASQDGSPTTTAERRSRALLQAQASTAGEGGVLGGEEGEEQQGGWLLGCSTWLCAVRRRAKMYACTVSSHAVST